MEISNNNIRKTIEDSGFYQWQIADAANIGENTLVRWLRVPLTQERIKKIIAAIEKLKKETQLEEASLRAFGGLPSSTALPDSFDEYGDAINHKMNNNHEYKLFPISELLKQKSYKIRSKLTDDGLLSYVFVGNGQGYDKLEEIEVVIPKIFDSTAEADSYIYDDWQCGLLGECIADYPPDEVSWTFNQEQESRKWKIVLTFVHERPAWEFYQRSRELCGVELADE